MKPLFLTIPSVLAALLLSGCLTFSLVDKPSIPVDPNLLGTYVIRDLDKPESGVFFAQAEQMSETEYHVYLLDQEQNAKEFRAYFVYFNGKRFMQTELIREDGKPIPADRKYRYGLLKFKDPPEGYHVLATVAPVFDASLSREQVLAKLDSEAFCEEEFQGNYALKKVLNVTRFGINSEEDLAGGWMTYFEEVGYGYALLFEPDGTYYMNTVIEGEGGTLVRGEWKLRAGYVELHQKALAGLEAHVPFEEFHIYYVGRMDPQRPFILSSHPIELLQMQQDGEDIPVSVPLPREKVIELIQVSFPHFQP